MVTISLSRFPRRITVVTVIVCLLTLVNIYLLTSDGEDSAPASPHLAFRSRLNGEVEDLFSTDEPILTIWTILRDDLKGASLEETAFETQQQWLEALHTYNALSSWFRLPFVQVIAYGTQSACDFASAHAKTAQHFRCLPIPCHHPDFGIPQYDCLFADSAARAQTPFVMYTNSDMVYFDDLLLALRHVHQSYDDFVMVGQRRDLLWPRPIDFDDSSWDASFRQTALRYGVLHGRFGIDYFIQRTKNVRTLPAFVVGRVRWDNWLLAQYIGNISSVAVDCTDVILAVHLNHMRVGDSHRRDGTDYNINLVKDERVDPKKIGDIDSCDVKLVSVGNKKGAHACPKCEFQRVKQNLDVMLYKHSDPVTRNIIIASVNSGYLDFALNWMCSLQRIGVTNFLFHAIDLPMYEKLLAMGLPVAYYESALAAEYKVKNASLLANGEPAFDYGSVAYQAVMNARTEFIYKSLQKGYNILLSDVDNVMLRDPFRFLDTSLAIQGGMHKSTKLTGGFLYLRSTDATLRVWIKVLLQHRELFTRMQSLTSYDPHALTEQELLNAALASDTKIAWKPLPESVVADGKRFFIDHVTQQRGEWPAVVHNNFVVGVEAKRQRFMNVSLWLLDEEMKCKPFPTYGVAPPPRGDQPLSLVIKVLAYNRPQAMLRLLTSLSEVDFMGDVVAIDIFVDGLALSDASNATMIAERLKVVRMAELFEWPHGQKRVVDRQENIGLLGQWLAAWFPTNPSQLAWFLEDDNVVSPVAYRYIRAAGNYFYASPTTRDPRLFGIALQAQHMIPGAYPDKPRDRLSPDTRFYRYQLLSTWGPVFFPNAWSDFVTWQSSVSANPSFLPLFSNLITNQWYMARGGGRSVWSSWFLRFAAERGLYSLYTNFAGGAALVVNYRDKGVNYNQAQGPNSLLYEELTERDTDFPPVAEIPLYDFHFNLIDEDPRILEGRAVYADIFNVETH